MRGTCGWRWHDGLWWGALPLLLLITNPSRFGLDITNLAKVEPHGSSSERVGFRFASVFLKSCSKTTYEGIKAPPSVTQRTWTSSWRVRVPQKGAHPCVHFGLSKLIKVPNSYTQT